MGLVQWLLLVVDNDDELRHCKVFQRGDSA